jgi:hypothetical protein
VGPGGGLPGLDSHNASIAGAVADAEGPPNRDLMIVREPAAGPILVRPLGQEEEELQARKPQYAGAK